MTSHPPGFATPEYSAPLRVTGHAAIAGTIIAANRMSMSTPASNRRFWRFAQTSLHFQHILDLGADLELRRLLAQGLRLDPKGGGVHAHERVVAVSHPHEHGLRQLAAQIEVDPEAASGQTGRFAASSLRRVGTTKQARARRCSWQPP